MSNTNKPQQYTKRPVTIEAIEFTGDNEIDIMNFVGKQLSVSKPPHRMEHDRDIPNDGYSIVIPTLEGNMLAIRGDYIIKGVKGEFYPCKPDIFSLTYIVNHPTGQLTAEDMLYLHASHILIQIDNVSKNLLLTAIENYAYQQTAALREELEAVKKERDEVVKLQQDASVLLAELLDLLTYKERGIFMNIKDGLSRLSSGETKPDTGANMASQFKKAMPETYPGKQYQPLFNHMQEQHGLTLLESETQEIISIVRKMDSPWIRVEDRLPEERSPSKRFSKRVWVGNPDPDSLLLDSDNYDYEENRWHRYGGRVKYWQPISTLPAPPESFNPEKQAGVISLANQMFGDGSLTDKTE